MNYLVVKDGDTFALTDQLGNMLPTSEKGLYTRDTRFLDTYELRINGSSGTVLHSSCEKNYVSTILLTNDEQVNDGQVQLRREQLEIKREQIVYNDTFYERVTVLNRSLEDMEVILDFKFGSQFVDLFEVRGTKRERRGTTRTPEVMQGRVILSYEGLDGVVRKSIIRCDQAENTTADTFRICPTVRPGVPWSFDISIQTAINDAVVLPLMEFQSVMDSLEASYDDWQAKSMSVMTDSDSFNRLIKRSLVDLRTLQSDWGQGPFFTAGIPWFAVPFGRDSLISALQMVLFRPDVAKGTLRTLASLQGSQVDRRRVEEPGKIVHEVRRGEMANLDEIPFGRYYGSVDSTPLFLILASEYYQVTDDKEFMKELMPSLLDALGWIESYSDIDEDGFAEYHTEDSGGLSVQSWKDSYDSMIHTNGRIANSPMAVSEMQGYVYAAKLAMAKILAEFGQTQEGVRLEREARELKINFNEAFWMPDKAFYALALDCDKRQVGVITSDPGHCLWTGIISEERIDAVAQRLLSRGMFSGWGIRTMSSEELAYSPISYHNGSVWAHDNSLILLGFSREGRVDEVNQLAEALLKASEQFEHQRLPELFCGHGTEIGSIVRYPVACEPQAWAAGTSLAMLQAVLGIEVDAANKIVRLAPTWPKFLSRITVTDLRVGEDTASFTVDQNDGLTVHDAGGICVELRLPHLEQIRS